MNRLSDQVIKFLENIDNGKVELKLDSVKELAERMGNVHKKIPCVHIAGTNGKGSTLAMVGEGLYQSGYKTGSYFSPQVFEDEPNIKIFGAEIDFDLLNNIYFKIIENYNQMQNKPSVFEIQTIAAFAYFCEQKCDIIIVECGMGGKYDATNILENKQVCVITPIALDHTKFLGNTLKEIALTKSGIFAENVPVVTANNQQSEVAEILKQQAELKQCNITVCEKYKNRQTDFLNQSFEYKGESYYLSLLGDYQCENAVTAIETLNVLSHNGFERININSVKKALQTCIWHGRFEVYSRHPLVLLDGSHNLQGAKALYSNIKEYLKGKEIIFLFGMLKDKDYKSIAELLCPLAKKVITITPPCERGLSGEFLAEIAGRYTASEYAGTIPEAIEKAFENYNEDTAVIAFGSLYSLNDIRKEFKNRLEFFFANRILNNNKFKNLLDEINNLEKSRIFCRHDIEHLMAVARTAQIINLRENAGLSPDLIYSAALLHDIGRGRQYAENICHEEAGKQLAVEIAKEVNMPESYISLIAEIVAGHNKALPQSENNSLLGIISRADKLSRNCFCCKARQECNWKTENLNLTIKI